MAKSKNKPKEEEIEDSQFAVLRRAAVPLCAIETQDPAQTIVQIKKNLGAKEKETPMLVWDISRSLYPLNAKGQEVVSEWAPNGPADFSNICEGLAKVHSWITDKNSEEDGIWHNIIFFLCNTHRFLGEMGVSQAIWNLREPFKSVRSTLVMLAPSLVLPEELKQDVVVISEPLPDEAKLKGIVKSLLEDADLKEEECLKDGADTRIVDTLRGLSAFAAEQVFAMSLSPAGVNEDTLWEKKRRMIEQTPGLEVWRGGETFDQIGGLRNLKRFLTAVLKSGNTPVRAILYLD